MNFVYHNDGNKEVLINIDNVNYITKSPNSNLSDVTFVNGDSMLTDVPFEDMKSILADMERKNRKMIVDNNKAFNVKVVNK